MNTKLIEEMYISKKWKLVKDFETLSLVELNKIIDEVLISLKKEENFDEQEFNKLCIFIKANISYDPNEILLDMFESNNWSPHKSLLRLSCGEINELFLNQMMNFHEKKIKFDNNKLTNMCLYIKSHKDI